MRGLIGFSILHYFFVEYVQAWKIQGNKTSIMLHVYDYLCLVNDLISELMSFIFQMWEWVIIYQNIKLILTLQYWLAELKVS